MTSTELGLQIACADFGVSPIDFQRHVGMAKVASENQGVVGRTVSKIAHEIMVFTGRGDTAPARHLEMLSKQASWYPQFQETVETVLGALRAAQTFQKQAVNSGDLVGGLGSLAKGVGYGSLLGGSGLGSLYWLLSRHASQDDADIEGMTHQRDYYEQLSSEIENAMRRKYQYENPANKKPKYRRTV